VSRCVLGADSAATPESVHVRSAVTGIGALLFPHALALVIAITPATHHAVDLPSNSSSELDKSKAGAVWNPGCKRRELLK
jgi:hypothetical protein